MQTQIRLPLEEQSDLGLHCLQHCIHVLLAYVKCVCLNFRAMYDSSKYLGCPKFRKVNDTNLNR